MSCSCIAFGRPPRPFPFFCCCCAARGFFSSSLPFIALTMEVHPNPHPTPAASVAQSSITMICLPVCVLAAMAAKACCVSAKRHTRPTTGRSVPAATMSTNARKSWAN